MKTKVIRVDGSVRWLIALAAVMCVWTRSYGAEPPVASGGTPAGGDAELAVRIVPRTAYGGTIYAIISVQNRGKKPLWINGRIVGSDPGMRGIRLSTRNAWLEINYQGAPVTFQCSAPAVPRHFAPTDYRLLLPGQSVDSEEDLSCFNLSRLGHYTATAHYLDQKGPPAPPRDAVPLDRELVSAPFSFDVMGAIEKLK